MRKHIEALLDEIALIDKGKERPWLPHKKTKRLHAVFHKLMYGSMTNAQVREMWDRQYELDMTRDIDWGEDIK